MNDRFPFGALTPLLGRAPLGDEWRNFWGAQDDGQTEWTPRIDVVDRPEAFVLTAEMAGLKPEDIQLRLQGDTLTLSGEKKQEIRKDDEHHKVVERRYGSFQRTVVFPSPVDSDNVDADLKEGVLTIRVMKKSEVRPAKIEVKVH